MSSSKESEKDDPILDANELNHPRVEPQQVHPMLDQEKVSNQLDPRVNPRVSLEIQIQYWIKISSQNCFNIFLHRKRFCSN